MHFLVTRPQPGADASAARLRANGHDVDVLPLLATEPVRWSATRPEAIMLTSAAAARLAGACWPDVPVFAVGDATAAAATAAGYRDVRDGGGTAQSLVDKVAMAGFGSILHLAGADRTEVVVPASLTINVAIVYAARLLPIEHVPRVDWVLLYSSRTAFHFVSECKRLQVSTGSLQIGVLSPAIAAAAGSGWREIVIAAQPNEAALLAAIEIACHNGRQGL